MSSQAVRDSVLVIGASGRTGLYVLRYLSAASVPTLACVRRAERLAAGRFGAGVEVAVADLEQPYALRPLFERAAHVIYVAGSDRKSLSPGAWQLEVECLSSCLELARDVGLPGRWLYVGYSGEQRGAANWAEARWRELKLAAEDAVASSGLNYVILRTGRVGEPVADEPRVFVTQQGAPRADATLPCNVLAFLLTGAVLSGATHRARFTAGLEPAGSRLQAAVQAFGRLQADAAGLQTADASLSNV